MKSVRVLALNGRWLRQKAKDQVTVTTNFTSEMHTARRIDCDASV
jgi:hypothetical protein